MAKQSNQKLKLLRIYDILLSHSDEEHPMTTSDIIHQLELYGITAERKSIYSDLEELILYGVDVVKCGGKKNQGYYIGARDFEIPELKLLVDAVVSCKFISESKSRQLIRKISALTSKHQSEMLNRQVIVSNRGKTINEHVLYNIDSIHEALRLRQNISFQYLNWNLKKQLVPRHNGETYHVSPAALIWDDENYYLIAYDHKSKERRHYRVDKMKSINLLDDDYISIDQEINKELFSSKMFGMYDGITTDVEFRCPISMAPIFIDQFGKEILIRQEDDDQCLIRVKVAISNQFFGWLSSMGDEVTIVSPREVSDQFRDFLKNILSKYRSE